MGLWGYAKRQEVVTIEMLMLGAASDKHEEYKDLCSKEIHKRTRTHGHAKPAEYRAWSYGGERPTHARIPDAAAEHLPGLEDRNRGVSALARNRGICKSVASFITDHEPSVAQPSG